MYSSLLLGSFIGLLLIGLLVFTGARRGWIRNGYFPIATTIIIVLGIFLLFQTIGGVLAILVGGTDPENYGLPVLAMNGVAQLVVMLCGTIALSLAFRQNPFAVFRLEGFHETPAWAYFLAFPIIISAQFAGVALSALWVRLLQFFPGFYAVMDKFESAGDKQMEKLVTANTLPEFMAIMLLVAIIPALAEETLFRGFAQSNIERSGHSKSRPIVALLVTSILFASIHLSLFKLPGLLCLGLCLGWMAFRTNNLFVSSLGHAANNGLIVIALYLSPRLGVDTANSGLIGNATLGTREAMVLLLQCLPVLAAFLYLFQRVTANIDARGNADREFARIYESSADLYPDFLASDENNDDTN